MLHGLIDLFRAGDPVPFVILAFIAIAWVIILEKFIVLQFVYHINFPKFTQTLRKMLAAGDMDRAKSFCKSTSKTGLPHIALRAVDTYESDNFRVRMVITEETLSFLPRIRRRISQLPALATCAILLGALAAVHGIWQSFTTADQLEMGIKTLAFTKGLGGALIPLAFSLFAAVFIMLPYGILDAVAGRLEADFEHGIAVILNLLAPEGPMVQSHSSAASSDPFPLSHHDSEPAPLSETHSHVAKVEHNDLHNERSEPLLDEEEII